MYKKVMPIKDWKLSLEGKQFILISDTSARRLKDGLIFTIGEKYIHDSSDYPEFIVYWEIYAFNADQIRVEFIVDAYSSMSYCQNCEINSIQIGKTHDKKDVVRVKQKITSRRRSPARPKGNNNGPANGIYDI